jgi:hypothetical protein
LGGGTISEENYDFARTQKEQVEVYSSI